MKRATREREMPSRVASHIRSIFSLPIALRVEAAILSVGEGSEFRGAKVLIKQLCESRRLQLVDVPYFATIGLSNSALDARLNPEGREAIAKVVTAFGAFINAPH
jgi:hypothetical protein